MARRAARRARSGRGMTARMLALGAAGEVVTGLVLAMAPALFIRLLMGVALSGPGIALGRLTGFALIALGVACWPLAEAGGRSPAVRALLAYGVLVTVYLVALGVDGALVGVLLWPAVVAHAIFTLLLARAWFGRSP